MISILAPSRGRPDKSCKTIDTWILYADTEVEVILSLDNSDPLRNAYRTAYSTKIVKDNNSAIDAINNAAKVALGDIFIVVSDDTDCFPGWDTALLKAVEGKADFILKTQDGIQPWIITMPVLDRAYYNRFGYIYHPDYLHLFADTYMTCVADINGRKLTSDLMFKHNHYSASGGKEAPDAINKKNDATWKQGEETFIRLMKDFTPEEISKIQDPGMKNWLRNKGVK